MVAMIFDDGFVCELGAVDSGGAMGLEEVAIGSVDYRVGDGCLACGHGSQGLVCGILDRMGVTEV